MPKETLMSDGKDKRKMELDKENIKKIMLILTGAFLIFWGINHVDTIVKILGKGISVISPFLLGFCFAFMVNVLMRRLELLWDKIGSIGKTKRLKAAGGRKTTRNTKAAGNTKAARNARTDKNAKAAGNTNTAESPKKTGGGFKRPVCLVLSLALIFGVIFIIFFMIIPEIQRNVLTIGGMIPQYFEQVKEWWNGITGLMADYNIVLPEIDLKEGEIGKILTDFVSKSGKLFLNTTMGLTVSIFSAVVDVILGLVFAIYVLLQKEKLAMQAKKLLYAVLPEKKVESFLALCSLTNKTFTNFVTGQLTEAVIIGVLCFVGMLILQMPYAPMISVLVGFTALIPMFGAFIGTAVGAFFILVDNPWKAVGFVVFIIILQQLEGNLIYPKVVGKSVGLPGIWVLVAVTIGGSLSGVIGMLFSVPISSVLYCIVRETVNRRLVKRGITVKEE